MAGKNTEEVYLGVDGIVATGAFGVAAAPTDATTALGATWTDLGYVSDQGVDETLNQSTTPLRAWQKNKVVRTVVEDGDVQYHFVLLQTSAETVAFYYGGTVATDGSIVIDQSAERPTLAFVLDVIDGDNVIRAYGPEAQVTEVGNQVYRNGEPVGYEVTVTCNYNEALGGSVKKWYSALDES
jgi:hypothetical protein